MEEQREEGQREQEEEEREGRRGRRSERHREEASLEDLAEAYFERARGMVPEEFIFHLRAARKELLLAARSLIDARIEKLEEAEQRRAGRRPTRVRIE